MKLPRSEKEIIDGFCRQITRQFGKEIVSIRLFGSWARGQATPDSDVDLLILTQKDDWHLADAINDLAYDCLLNQGVYISPKVMSQAHFNWIKSIQSPFAEAVEREAMPL